MPIGVKGLGWDVEKSSSKRGRDIKSMKNTKVVRPSATPTSRPTLTPQQIRSIKQSPKGKLPSFLNKYLA